MQFKTKVRASVKEDITEKEYLQVQTCLACCWPEVHEWVLAANKFGDQDVTAWTVRYDPEFFRIHVLPSLAMFNHEVLAVEGALKTGSHFDKCDVERICHNSAEWKRSFRIALSLSMQGHVTPRARFRIGEYDIRSLRAADLLLIERYKEACRREAADKIAAAATAGQDTTTTAPCAAGRGAKRPRRVGPSASIPTRPFVSPAGPRGGCPARGCEVTCGSGSTQGTTSSSGEGAAEAAGEDEAMDAGFEIIVINSAASSP